MQDGRYIQNTQALFEDLRSYRDMCKSGNYLVHSQSLAYHELYKLICELTGEHFLEELHCDQYDLINVTLRS